MVRDTKRSAVLPTNEARQGYRSGVIRILFFSLLLAAIAAVFLGFYFEML